MQLSQSELTQMLQYVKNTRYWDLAAHAGKVPKSQHKLLSEDVSSVTQNITSLSSHCVVEAHNVYIPVSCCDVAVVDGNVGASPLSPLAVTTLTFVSN